MDTVNNSNEEHGQDLLNHLLFRFAPYWILFILLLLLSFAGAWYYINESTPLYQANASILLKDERKGVDDAKMLQTFDIYTTTKIVENEIEVVRSRDLMTEVVERLKLYATIYEQGAIRDQNAYVSSPVLIEVKKPKSLFYSGKVPFSYNADQTVTMNGQTHKLNKWYKTQYGELRFRVNPKFWVVSKNPLYFVLDHPANVAGGLTSGLIIKPTNKMSTVLGLSFIDESPERAKDILNELMKVYEQNTIEEKNALAANTLKFLEDRINFLVRDLDSIEQTIQKYKSTEGIVNLSEQGRLFLNNVGDNDRRIGTINMQLAILDAIEKYVISKNNKAGLVPSTVGLNDEVLTKLVHRLYDAELQYDRIRQTMGENSPEVVSILNEIQTIRPAILENVANQKASLKASKEDLASTTQQYNSVIRAIPQKERRLLDISREQSIKNSIYTFLLQKREETVLSSSTTVSDSRIIDSAVASWVPVSPKKVYIYVAAVLIALVIGALIILAKEFLPGKILFRSDIERATRVPIAAEIASLNHKSELVVSDNKKSFIGEQFRHLRAAIGLYGRFVNRQKILVTSSIPGEGKSFVACNLALSLSLSGKSVVLIDADFRNPKSSTTFNLREEQGLADYLSNDIDVHDIIKPTSFTKLFVIPSGGVYENPTELLLNGKLNEFFTYIGSQFDYVVVDTSPVTPVTDAYILSDYCDKTLFVVRHGHTPKYIIKNLDDNNRVKILKNLAIVFNGVKKRGFIKGHSGYGYGYGYEQIYKDEKEGRKKAKT